MTLPSPTLKSLKRLALIVLLLFGASDGADALVEVGLLTWSRDPQTEKIIAGLAERIAVNMTGGTKLMFAGALNRPGFRSVLEVRMEPDEPEVFTGDA